jgi:hypothetical protein
MLLMSTLLSGAAWSIAAAVKSWSNHKEHIEDKAGSQLMAQR